MVYQPKSGTSNLFNFKDVANTRLCSHVVCKFMCSSCYITFGGQTQRNFFVRAPEHLRISPLMGKFVKKSKQGFIQAILMSVRRHKKLSLKIEFWNSIILYMFLIILLFVCLFVCLFLLNYEAIEFICSGVFSNQN